MVAKGKKGKSMRRSSPCTPIMLDGRVGWELVADGGVPGLRKIIVVNMFIDESQFIVKHLRILTIGF